MLHFNHKDLSITRMWKAILKKANIHGILKQVPVRAMRFSDTVTVTQVQTIIVFPMDQLGILEAATARLCPENQLLQTNRGRLAGDSIPSTQ